MPKKVICAMSGGVDSSVSAALLKRAGFDVVGIFMRFWREPGQAKNRCCSLESEKRARAVARILNIPFYVLNFEKEFKKRIVNYFLGEYQRGVTPNPCVVCNKEIKFGLLLEKALALGADYVATGHYAKKIQNPMPTGRQAKSKIQKLYRAKDKNKDQSYFLWLLNQKQLKRILFPLGNRTKKEVRVLAKKFDLPTAETPESMEICFVQASINDFLAKHIKTKPGPIYSKPDSEYLGKHQGLAFYTLGQRKGIGLSGGPYWVVAKDLEKNTLIVTKNEKDLFKKELTFKNVNWLSGKTPKLPLKVKAKIRYRSQLASATVYRNNRVVFSQPQRAITPGQSVVFYLPCRQAGKNQELLGGGIIV